MSSSLELNCTGTFGMFGRLFGRRDVRNERKADAEDIFLEYGPRQSSQI